MSLIDESTTLREKLEVLVQLQVFYNRLNALYQQQGELPKQIEDKEDLIEGQKTILRGMKAEKAQLEERIVFLRHSIEESRRNMLKWEKDLERIRDDAHYAELRDLLAAADIDIQKKEREIKTLSAKILDVAENIKNKESEIAALEEELGKMRTKLQKIQQKNAKEESRLQKQIDAVKKKLMGLDERLLRAFERRLNILRDKRAVVGLAEYQDRMACGGCYVLIPRQTQILIQQRSRLILCESCGRILVDNAFIQAVERSME